MRVKILKPIGGYGTFVQDAPRLFSLCEGDEAVVEDEQARKWIASGIAAPVPLPAAEAAFIAPTQNAMLPKPRGRRGSR